MAKIKLNGDTSGYIEISAPAVSGNNTLELGPGTRILTNLDNTFTGVSTFSSDVYLGNDIYLTDGSSGYEKVEVDANDIRVEHKHIHSEFGVWTRSTSITDRRLGIEGAANDLLLYANSAEKVRITSGGNVGINETNPSGKLEVKAVGATAVFNSGAANDGRLEFEYNSSRVGLLAYHSDRLEIQTDSGKDFAIRTNGANDRVRITSAGQLLAGATVARTDFATTPQVQIEGLDFPTSSLSITRNSNDNGRPTLFFGKSRGGVDGATTIVADGDGLGTIEFAGADGDQLHRAALIAGQVDGTPSNNGMKGRLVFSTNNGGTSATERLRITSGGQLNFGGNLTQTGFTASITRNSSETDILRIKGNGGNAFIRFEDNDASSSFTLGADDAVGSGGFALYDRSDSAYRVVVDTAGRVSINSTSPAQIGGQTPYLYVASGYANLDGLRIRGLDTGNTLWKTGGEMSITVASDHAIKLKTQSATRLNVAGNGYVTKPNQPSFHATNTTIGQINTDFYGTIVFNDVTSSGNHNIGSHYNAANGVFTAPIAGRYLICARTLTNSTANSNLYVSIFVRLNGTNIAYLGHNHTDSWIMESYSGVLSLAANDNVSIYVDQASGHGGQAYASFSGHLLS